jgi:hypothetical protein
VSSAETNRNPAKQHYMFAAPAVIEDELTTSLCLCHLFDDFLLFSSSGTPVASWSDARFQVQQCMFAEILTRMDVYFMG